MKPVHHKVNQNFKFLHLSDIHLGIKRYNYPPRSDDFFLALQDCLHKYAIQEKVDFVLLGGDIFDVKKIESWAFDQAVT